MKVKVTIGCQVYCIKSTLLSASFNPQRGGQGVGKGGGKNNITVLGGVDERLAIREGGW